MDATPDVVAVVLAGGLGTRLRPITYSVPKPLVEVDGKPFIHYLLVSLKKAGIRKCLLLTGYMHEKVEAYCKDGREWGLGITYSPEKEQLGTGGAILNAAAKIRSTALVLNGDSLLGMDVGEFLAWHKKNKAWVTVYANRGELEGRGAIVMGKGSRVAQFLEKQKKGDGIFNTGAYLIEPEALDFLRKKMRGGELGTAFSMEREGFPLFVTQGTMHAYVGEGPFLDMGTHETLAQAGTIVRLMK
ncbi:MAG: nucleotidyltransferase family protein [Candidatus Micrarchaeia archaeon]